MWYTNFGASGDVILSSRVRLARNIKDFPFPHRASEEKQKEIISILSGAAEKIPDTKFFDLSKMEKREKAALSECHLISPNMLNGDIHRALVLSNDQRLSIMINEEDHLRIQAMHEGLSLCECQKAAFSADDIIESSVEYGFDEKLGYLTCCPTNVGTGLRASVMAHLPAFKMSGRIDALARSLSQMGFTIRGIFGEGSRSLGDIYQISNQVTLGISEEETLDRLTEAVEEIVNQERTLLQKIYEADKFRIEDKVCRALGTLKYSKIISSDEAMSLISDVRAGVNLGIIKETNLQKLSEALYAVLPATLSRTYNLESAADRDIKRAEVIKETL